MTIEDVIQAIEDQTGCTLKAQSNLYEAVADSLEFTDLILAVSEKLGDVPDSAIPYIETVEDIYRTLVGEMAPPDALIKATR